jgi:NitT/TauT family transport system ATP-binding protein
MLITHALDEAAMLADQVGVMSARPGKFLDVISTGWPRSRTSEIISHPDFGTITARIWSTLRAESLKSMSCQTVA